MNRIMSETSSQMTYAYDTVAVKHTNILHKNGHANVYKISLIF